jgi:hypothetical protein
VIYFHACREQQIRMLLIYRKGVKDDLSGPMDNQSTQGVVSARPICHSANAG